MRTLPYSYDSSSRKRYKTIRRPEDWHSFLNDYRQKSLGASTYDLASHYRESNVTMSSHFIKDALMMFMEPWQQLVVNPLAENTWKDMIQKEYDKDEYKNLNKKTARNPMMAQLAARNMVDGIVQVARKAQKAMPQQPNQGGQQGQQSQQQSQNQQQQNQGGNHQGQNPNQQGNQPGQGQGKGNFNFNNFMNQMQGLMNGNAGNAQTAQQIMNGVSAAMSKATQQSQNMMDTLNSFSHSGVPMKRMGDVDEMRSVLSNKVVVDLAKVMKKLATDSPGKSTSKPSPLKGIPLGVKKMGSHQEIPDIVMQEYAYEAIDPDLFSYRVMSMQSQTIERFSSMNKYLVYIDKSGSMSWGDIKFGNLQVSPLAAACGMALNLAMTLRKEGGEMILKLMDVEVGDPISDLWEIMKTLVSIEADSGTNITAVLDDISIHGRDYKSVLMSDGIDDIEENAARAVKDLDVTSILINESSPILEKYTKVRKVTRFSGENMLLDI